jgi:hypothetical protein
VRIGDDRVVRHLTERQALGALDRGRCIEQLLAQSATDPSMIEWLRLSPQSSGVMLVRHRVRDVGTADYLDVYEFPPVELDEEHGEGSLLATLAGSAEALAASVEHGARADLWVMDGMIQDEYAAAARH